MALEGPDPWSMRDESFVKYLYQCEEIASKLDTGIKDMMVYIFSGKSRCHQEWESLFKAVCQAHFMRDFLNQHCANIFTIADNFLSQLEEWKQEVDGTIN